VPRWCDPGLSGYAILRRKVRSRPCQRHAIECQEQTGLRYFGEQAAAELTQALLPQAMEDDRLAHLAALAMEACRQRRIISPSPLALEGLCAELRHQGRRVVYRRLTNGLAAEQRKRLDALTERRDETGQVWLTWLRQMPEAATPTGMLGVIERLEHVRAVGVDPSRGHLIHQARLSQLAREADKTTVQACCPFRAAAPACDVGGHHLGFHCQPDRPGDRSFRPPGRRDIP
jgi:Domain of unknown function (DUF4158)